MKIRSRLTGEMFNPEQTVPVIDFFQAEAYMQNRIIPKDVYLCNYSDTNTVKIVFLFDKKESYDAYQKWRKRELEYTIKNYGTDKTDD